MIKKSTIPGQIYCVTASATCEHLEVEARTKDDPITAYILLRLKSGEQGTFQAISDEVRVHADADEFVMLPFDAARAAVLGAGNKGENTDTDLALSVMRESIGYLESGQHALIMQDELHNEKFSEIENDLLEIHSAIENDFTLSENLKESLSLISTDEFRSFAEWAQWDNAQTDLLKICQGDFSAHINNSSLHGGGSASLPLFSVNARTLNGEELAPVMPPPPSGVTVQNLACVIDLNMLATYLESYGYKFCDENGASSSGGSSEGYNRFIVSMQHLENSGPPMFQLGDVASSYETISVNGKTFTRKGHINSSQESVSIFYGNAGVSFVYDGDGEVSLKEFVNAFHEQISSLWTDEQHDLIQIIPSYRYEW